MNACRAGACPRRQKLASFAADFGEFEIVPQRRGQAPALQWFCKTCIFSHTRLYIN